MNKEQALLIKKWRIEEGCTWRKVAEKAAAEWPERDYLLGDQLIGMDLCTLAAATLGEKISNSQW